MCSHILQIAIIVKMFSIRKIIIAYKFLKYDNTVQTYRNLKVILSRLNISK